MSLSPFADRSPLVDLLGEGAEEAAERESSVARRSAWWLFNAGQAAFTVGWSAALISAAVGVAVGARSPRPALWLARRVWAPGLLWGRAPAWRSREASSSTGRSRTCSCATTSR